MSKSDSVRYAPMSLEPPRPLSISRVDAANDFMTGGLGLLPIPRFIFRVTYGDGAACLRSSG